MSALRTVLTRALQMPTMDGFMATHMIRAHEAEQSLPPTPIIAMTAFTMPEDQQKCVEAGMSDYISKPFTQEKLRDVIMRNVLQPKHTQRRRPASGSSSYSDSKI